MLDSRWCAARTRTSSLHPCGMMQSLCNACTFPRLPASARMIRVPGRLPSLSLLETGRMKTRLFVYAVLAAMFLLCVVVCGQEGPTSDGHEPRARNKRSLDDSILLTKSANSHLRVQGAKDLGGLGREAHKAVPVLDHCAPTCRAIRISSRGWQHIRPLIGKRDLPCRPPRSTERKPMAGTIAFRPCRGYCATLVYGDTCYPFITKESFYENAFICFRRLGHVAGNRVAVRRPRGGRRYAVGRQGL